ncbi:MAG: hypothetical protein K2H13_08990 [Eubacterium sp.]|nr:hypothetical protein [Eubacterium sp.]
MKKKISKIAAFIMAALIIFSSFSAFAATGYVNSTGSEASDIAVLDDSTYIVAGKDTTQNQKSEYTEIQYADETITSKCDVYATVAEGEKVYDPTNPDADENGFVDGSILVGVPTVLIMDAVADENGYYIAKAQGRVKGNITGATIINVVPEASFTMSQDGKDDITAIVTQDFTKFVVPTSDVTGADINKNVTPSFNDNAVFNVTVATNQATAGSWHGSFTYTISTSTAA